MKKYILILSIVLVTLSIGCSKDTEISTTPSEEKLEITASSTAITVGERVYFTAYSKGKEITDVDYYINTVVITSTYLFTNEGVFEIVAKKRGYIDSNPIKITVVAKSEMKELVLSSSDVEVMIGNTVNFTVKSAGVLQTDATIHVVGSNELSNATWNASVIGTFKFIAKKTGYKDSNVLEIKVIETGLSGTGYIEIGSDFTYLNYSRLSVEATENTNGTFTPMSYIDKLDSTKRYYVFNLDVGAVENNRYTARANIRLAVYHNPNSNTLVYPGYSTIYPTVFIDSYTTLDMRFFEYFESKDIQQMEFKTPGLMGTINLLLENKDAKVSFNGELSNRRLGYVIVDENGKDLFRKGIIDRTLVYLPE